jgi:hypothetical protein
MAEQNEVRVSDLLPDGLQMEQTVKAALSKDEGIGAAKLAWGFIGSQATNAMTSVLNLDAFELVARGWCVAKELHEFTDQSKHPIGERSVVFLGEHSFSTSLFPTLAITIAPYKTVSLRFTLNLVADIRGVSLAICNGHVTGVGPGDGAIGAHLSYDGVELNKLESKKVQFPGNIEFKAPGLAII